MGLDRLDLAVALRPAGASYTAPGVTLTRQRTGSSFDCHKLVMSVGVSAYEADASDVVGRDRIAASRVVDYLVPDLAEFRQFASRGSFLGRSRIEPDEL